MSSKVMGRLGGTEAEAGAAWAEQNGATTNASARTHGNLRMVFSYPRGGSVSFSAKQKFTPRTGAPCIGSSNGVRAFLLMVKIAARTRRSTHPPAGRPALQVCAPSALYTQRKSTLLQQGKTGKMLRNQAVMKARYPPSARSRAGILSVASSWPHRVQYWSLTRTVRKQCPQLAESW